MQKEILQQILDQSQDGCDRIFREVNNENAVFRLNPQTASVGFIYRHIGEATNLVAQYFGYNNKVETTTFGQIDTGRQYDLEVSRALYKQGYATFKKMIDETPDNDWLEEIDTDLFGRISKIRVFSITLFHNAHHCGQIASAIVKGKKY